MAATPAPVFIFQGPADYTGYDRKKHPSEQPSDTPQTFIDAMKVREEVFVREQGVSLDHEMDDDDPRSCHWVVYIANAQGQPGSEPSGTLRCVPFPHPPHPMQGGRYIDGELLNGAELATPQDLSGVGVEGHHHQPDRPTSLHDGHEPYVKLGRLAVTQNARGKSIASLMVKQAFEWMRKNPTFFDQNNTIMPAVEAVEAASGNTAHVTAVSGWNGLVCVHAQKQILPFWRSLGFEIDDEMGEWWEENILHVGMFKRLDNLGRALP